jgi:hypothetical protein
MNTSSIDKEKSMIKRRLIIALLILFPLVVGIACLGSAGKPTEETRVTLSPEAAEETVEETAETVEEESESIAAETPKELIMLEKSLWVQEEKTVFVSFFFQNPNTDLIYEDVEYTVYLYNANGDEIDNDNSFVRWIFPEQTFGIVFNFYLSEEDIIVNSVSVEWEYRDTRSPNGFTTPFTVEEATFWQNGDFPMVTGKINNANPETCTNIRANIICYNASGEIVGGGFTYVKFVPGSDYMGYAAYVDVFDEVANVEVHPTFTYTTVFYEGDQFWSDISILDDYFYTDKYGSIHGGAVIQNNTNDVLEGSILSITFYDEAGNITTSGDIAIDILFPGEILGVTPWVLSPPYETTSTNYDLIVLPGVAVEDYELQKNPFTVNEVSVVGDYDTQVLVNFTNAYSKQVSEANVYVLLYNADGQIIGGGNDWTKKPVPPSGSAEIEVWVNYPDSQGIDHVDVWVVPNIWTEFE